MAQNIPIGLLLGLTQQNSLGPTTSTSTSSSTTTTSTSTTTTTSTSTSSSTSTSTTVTIPMEFSIDRGEYEGMIKGEESSIPGKQ